MNIAQKNWNVGFLFSWVLPIPYEKPSFCKQKPTNNGEL